MSCVSVRKPDVLNSRQKYWEEEDRRGVFSRHFTRPGLQTMALPKNCEFSCHVPGVQRVRSSLSYLPPFIGTRNIFSVCAA